MALTQTPEDGLKISNAGSNGQFLQKQSGDTGGLTWASVSTTDSTKMPLAGGTFTGDVIFDNATNAGKDLTWDMSDDSLEFADNTKAVFGDGGDLKIYHNGTDNYIMPSNGKLIINNGSETLASFTSNGAVVLYCDDSCKFKTESYGPLQNNGNFRLPDGTTADAGWGRIQFGAGQDLQMYHSGSHSYITNDTGKLFLQAKSGEHSIECEPDESVKLYYNNSKKLETLTTGISVEGSIRIGGAAAANEFDDYEEGTWTPRLGGENIGSYNITGTGTYTKIGRLVFCKLRFTDQDLNNSASGTVRIDQLPFTPHAGGLSPEAYSIMGNFLTHNGYFNNDKKQGWEIQSGGIMVGLQIANGGAWVGWSVGDFDLGGFYMNGSFSYIAT